MSTLGLSSQGITAEEFKEALLSTSDTDIVYRTNAADMRKHGYNVGPGPDDMDVMIYARQIIVGHELLGFIKETDEIKD